MKEIRVGILHSLSGTMASSEMHLVDAALFAIDEINKQGGVLGKQLLGVVEDGCSDPEIFKLKAEKLLEQDGVHVVSGCWTSSSRKAVLDNIQDKNVFLLYPVQYEGLEENPNVLYSGSCLNQQISPAIEWCLTQGHENFYLVGSNYVFPRTVNALIKSLLLDRGANILGENYLPLDSTDFKDVAKSIKFAQPDFVINTINGESNAGFFTHYNKSGNEFPVMSFSIAEHDLRNLGIQSAAHYLCWSYFQNLDNKVNQKFLRDFGKYNKINLITSDPMVMTYSQIRLWSQAVEKAGSLDIEAVRAHLHGQRLNSPAGLLEVMPNNHLLKSTFIGKQISDKKFEVIWKSYKRIKPEPWLGMEEVELPSTKLVLDALAQYPNLIHLNTSLQTANLELKEAKRELEKHRDHLEEIVGERTKVLHKSESTLAEAQRMAHIGNWELDLVSNTLTWSDEVYRMFGLEPQQFEATYEAFLDNIHPDDREMANKAYTESVRTKTPYNIVHRLLLKDGTIKYVNERCETFYDDDGKPVRSIGTVQDITERKRAEAREKLLQQELNLSSRLASIGEMAAGIAHEINNPLTGVIGFSQLLMEKDIPEDIKQDLKIINDNAQRVVTIVRNMLSFARPKGKGKEYVDINSIVSRVLEVRSYKMKTSNIAVTPQLAPDLPRTMADDGQIQQVLMNIIINAEQAMIEAHGKGKLLVITEKANNMIRISITDDGPGIAKEQLDKIFDPFFTTKEPGEGTGLGLSISYTIIKEHDGRLYAESQVGKGTTFVVELPIVPTDEKEAVK